MNEPNIRLIERENEGRPIQVAQVGAGQMGTEIITQIGEMKGMEVAVVVDMSEAKARRGYADSKKKPDVFFTDDLAEAEKAVSEGKKIATTNYKIATRLSTVEAVVDSTGSTEIGAVIALDCIDNKKHIVMMNVECDITIGPILRQMAENAGIV